MDRTSLLAVIIVALVCLASVPVTGGLDTANKRAESPTSTAPCNPMQELDEQTRKCLAQTYSPVFHFHEDEQFRPTSIRAFIKRAEIDGENVTPQTLAGRTEELELHDPSSKAYTYRAYPDLPRVVYTHITTTRYEFREYVAITYWTFYFHDNKVVFGNTEGAMDEQFHGDEGAHQADFESVTILVNSSGAQYIGASQHYGGERRSWVNVRKANGTHPHLYPAKGAHAIYFVNTAKTDGKGIIGQKHTMTRTVRAPNQSVRFKALCIPRKQGTVPSGRPLVVEPAINSPI